MKTIYESICTVDVELSSLDETIALLQKLKETYEGKMTSQKVKFKSDPERPWKISEKKELIVGPWSGLCLTQRQDDYSNSYSMHLEGSRPETYEEAELRIKSEKLRKEMMDQQEKQKYEELKKKWG